MRTKIPNVLEIVISGLPAARLARLGELLETFITTNAPRAETVMIFRRAASNEIKDLPLEKHAKTQKEVQPETPIQFDMSAKDAAEYAAERGLEVTERGRDYMVRGGKWVTPIYANYVEAFTLLNGIFLTAIRFFDNEE